MVSPRIKKMTKFEKEQVIVKDMDAGTPLKVLVERYGMSREELSEIYQNAKKITLGE